MQCRAGTGNGVPLACLSTGSRHPHSNFRRNCGSCPGPQPSHELLPPPPPAGAPSGAHPTRRTHPAQPGKRGHSLGERLGEEFVRTKCCQGSQVGLSGSSRLQVVLGPNTSRGLGPTQAPDSWQCCHPSVLTGWSVPAARVQ